MKFTPVIGLEIHVQLNTKSKMFCGCSAEVFGRKPNTQVCPVCLGLPGAIPSPPNIKAIEKAVLVAKALDCQLAENCRFERKNYFYPDLSKGYQISQYQTAIGKGGEFATWDGEVKVRIRRVHLEEDAAKLIHEPGQTLIDFNRAGVPLLEIVTEPDLQTPDQTKAILKELQALPRYLKVSDVDMEKGSMRLEANLSLRKAGTQEPPDLNSKNFTRQDLPPYKVELKNINSFKFLVRALECEIERQRTLLSLGKKVIQETRGYSEERDETFSQRRKEEAFDYRYFPEPDLPPLMAKLLTHRGRIVLPGERWARFERRYQLPRQYRRVLVADPELVTLFEETVQAAGEFTPEEVANMIVNRRFGDPKKLGVRGLIRKIKEVKEKARLSELEIKRSIKKVILDNPKAVGDYKAGKEAALHFLLGSLMKEIKGKADPTEAKRLMEEELSQPDNAQA